MMNKLSSEKVSPEKTIGDDLNYNLIYNYDENYAHRLKHVGNRYYKYDSNGNIICEKDGSFDEETVDYGHVINQEAENVYSTDYGWGLTKESDSVNKETVYQRTYTWNEKNQLISSVDSRYSTVYVYGQDGQRSNKYTDSSETVYFNKMWTLHTDSGNARYGGQYAKNIYLGDTRIVTKLNSGDSPSYQEEYYKQYFYHSDHLGSASLISDYKGDEYQRIEYTPYGETWVEKTSNTGTEYLPYKFTGKEIDEETGLYYYGARYLDPKYSLWISTDPALGEYVPAAGKANSKDSGNLPGMGGVFNHINFNLYRYAGNNPVKYSDPDGNIAISAVLLGSLVTAAFLVYWFSPEAVKGREQLASDITSALAQNKHGSYNKSKNNDQSQNFAASPSPLPPDPNDEEYESNPKHHQNAKGNASKEPENAEEMFKNSVKDPTRENTRWYRDKNGNFHRFQGSNKKYHWNGSTDTGTRLEDVPIELRRNLPNGDI